MPEARRIRFLQVLKAAKQILDESEGFSSIDDIAEKIAAKFTDPKAPDWAAILAFIKELLPIILQILVLF